MGGKPCECGCGAPVMSRKARFLPGHNAKLMVRTEEHRRRIGEATKRRWATLRVPGFKRCPKCGDTKPREEFGIRKNGHSRAWCRRCERKVVNRWRVANPKKVEACAKRGGLFTAHGIREEEFAEILEVQGGGCAICGAKTPGMGAYKQRGRLYIDHCHSTMEIRGLLCNHCNFGIGLFRDDPELMRKAAVYVETARTGKFSRSRRGRKGGKPREKSGPEYGTTGSSNSGGSPMANTTADEFLPLFD